MDIEKLRELGGFVSPTPVEKEVTWQPRNEDGTPLGEPVTFTVRIKKLSAAASSRVFAKDEKDIEADRDTNSMLLSNSLMMQSGDDWRFITYEEASNLALTLAAKFTEAVNAANGWSDAAAKNSQPPTNSGTTS